MARSVEFQLRLVEEDCLHNRLSCPSSTAAASSRASSIFTEQPRDASDRTRSGTSSDHRETLRVVRVGRVLAKGADEESRSSRTHQQNWWHAPGKGQDSPAPSESDLPRRLLLAGTATSGIAQTDHLARPVRSRSRRVCSSQSFQAHEAAARIRRTGHLRSVRLRFHGRDQEGPVRVLPLHRAQGSVRQHVRRVRTEMERNEVAIVAYEACGAPDSRTRANRLSIVVLRKIRENRHVS